MTTRLKVGLFAIAGLIAVGATTVFVNDKPFWWRPCQLVHINIEDATGLKTKSPIRSLGLQIGYLRSVELSETYVTLGICITAPVEILPATRAYVRSEGFLGDKFVELKPVKYTGPSSFEDGPTTLPTGGASGTGMRARTKPSRSASYFLRHFELIASAHAQEATATPTPVATPTPKPTLAPATRSPKRARPGGGREIPVGESNQDVQALVARVDGLVNEMTGLTNNLKQAINPEDLRKTVQQLNRTLENASKTLSPEGGLNQTAQRTLAKLEDSIEQLRAMLTRVNQGQGSIGMLINDPSYAEEIKLAIKNVNKILNKVGDTRFVVDLGAEKIRGYENGRGWFRLAIWPKRDRYYLLGVSLDPRGRRTETTTTTTAGGVTTVSRTIQVEETGVLFTAMLGKVFFERFEVAIGVLHGDGAITTGVNLGPTGREEMVKLTNDVYSRSGGAGFDDRVSLVVRPFMGSGAFSPVYARGGLEATRYVSEKLPWFYGAGLTFDDDDIKLLFTLVGAGR